MALATNVRMDQWDWDYFLTVRHEVLRQWPTGDELMDPATLDESVARQREQPWWKFASLRNEQAMKEDRLQLVPSCGHALVEQVSDHIHESEDLKPDRWHVFTDTYSRKCQFAKSQDAIERSRRDGFSYLNGYPIVLHGVAGARALNESTTVPLSTDGNDEDARLAWEIALAGGWTCGTIKSIEQVIQHSRDYPLELMIYNHQYIDRLTAYFNERGVPILRRDFANLSGWDTLGFKVAVGVIQGLLAAAQGTKYMDLGIATGMGMVQDVAGIQVVSKLAPEYFERFGFHNVHVYPWAYNYVGDWPREPISMAGQIAWNTAVAALAGCNGCQIKSPDEARTTVTGKGNREAMLVAAQIARLLKGQRLPESEELSLEREMIEKEARAILEKVLELGDGDVALGACRAVEAGVLDTVFSPWLPLRSQVKLVRDARGAVRYLDHGNVPLPPEVIEYHRSRIAERERRENTTADLDWVIQIPTWASRPLSEEAAERPY